MRIEEQILCRWYVGELGGDALFSELASRSAPAAAHKWHALAQVEVRVAERLADEFGRRAWPLPVAHGVRERALARCDQLEGQSWLERMAWLNRIATAALVEMTREAAHLPAELHALGALVLRHEAALIAFAEGELNGNGGESLAPLHGFLQTDSIN